MKIEEDLRFADLIKVISIYKAKKDKASKIDDFYFEPGEMENLDQYDGVIDEEKSLITIMCPVKGLRFGERSINLTAVKVGDELLLQRDPTNEVNNNNFLVLFNNNELGSLPAELCNAIAPLYDLAHIDVVSISASYIEQLNDRSRYATSGILFVKLCFSYKI